MKKLIALVLALILGMSFLSGCGDTQESKRRDAAKGIFGITDSEYGKNREYYDALLSDYYDYKELFTDNSAETKEEQISVPHSTGVISVDNDMLELFLFNPEVDPDDRFVLQHANFTPVEIMDFLRQKESSSHGTGRYARVTALKKGDSYYTIDINTLDDRYRLYDYSDNMFYLINGKTFTWPDLSLSAGDAIVCFYIDRDNANRFHEAATLSKVSSRGSCLDLVLERHEDTASENSLHNDDPYAVSPQGYKAYSYIAEINDVPVFESPLLLEKNSVTNNLLSRTCYLINGDQGESIMLGGYLNTDGNWYEEKRIVDSYFYNIEANYTYRIDDRPLIDNSYSVLMDKDTDPVEPGIYFFNQYPIKVVK